MPHVQDPETVLLLAKISSNVYNRKSKMPWFDVSMKNQSHLIHSFGWDDSFLRGYIYADLKREVVIIAFKGTDTRFSSDDSHDTAFSDKWMDNSMFSCCCSSGAKSNAVCGCQRSGRNQCSVACLADSLKDPQYTRYSYFIMAQRVFDNVRRRYPHSAIWLTGHSLGGALASLIGIANGVPAVTFEIPGDLRFARRLGLIPHNLKDESAFLSRLPVYHFGNVNDPIFMGSCNGPFSLCYIDGFSIETRCRTGKVCVYDEREYKGKDKSVKHLVSQKDMKGSAASRPRGNIFSHLVISLVNL